MKPMSMYQRIAVYPLVNKRIGLWMVKILARTQILSMYTWPIYRVQQGSKSQQMKRADPACSDNRSLQAEGHTALRTSPAPATCRAPALLTARSSAMLEERQCLTYREPRERCCSCLGCAWDPATVDSESPASSALCWASPGRSLLLWH